jgi:hypothetical protein
MAHVENGQSPLLKKDQLPKNEKEMMLHCIFCQNVSPTSEPKLLPCLHMACQQCLEQHVATFYSTPVVSNDEVGFSQVILSCPRCTFKTQLPKHGIQALKGVRFLQPFVEGSNTRAELAELQFTSDGLLTSVKSAALDNHVDALPEVMLPGDNSNHSSADRTVHSDIASRLEAESSVSQTNDTCATDKRSTFEDPSFETVDKCTVDGHHYTHSERHNNDVDSDKVVGRNRNVDDNEWRTSVTRIQKLLQEARQAERECKTSMSLVETAQLNLEETRESLREIVNHRAERLCRLINARRDHLLDNIEKHFTASEVRFRSTRDQLCKQAENLNYCAVFTDAVLSSDKREAYPIVEDMAARISHLAGSISNRSMLCGQNIPEISALHLTIPDVGHEESQLERLFGTLVSSTVGNTELIMSFNTELRWPTAFVVTRSRDSVLAGKTGAFADSGRLIFYDRQGVCTNSLTLTTGRLPIDLVASSDGSILMSDVSGRVSKYSCSGRLLSEWFDIFRGTSGRMCAAVCGGGVDAVLVTSAQDGLVRRCSSSDGQLLKEFTLKKLEGEAKLEPSAIATNSVGEIIVTVANDCFVYFFTCDGTPLRSFHLPVCGSKGANGSRDEAVEETKAAKHLLSAICCDPFDNVLVADFIANCVHLLSRSGRYLGRLLTEKDGISCPNFVSIDPDGRLYVGQYGGEILVFQYLSFVKNV